MKLESVCPACKGHGKIAICPNLVGQKIRIPKGAIITRYGPDWPIKREPAKRAKIVTVKAIHGPYDHAPQLPAVLGWDWRGFGRSIPVTDVEVVA